MQPQNAAALAALRKLLVGAGELTSALQLAELEEVPLAAKRARLLVEIGELWCSVGDARKRGRFTRRSSSTLPATRRARRGASVLAESAARDEAIRCASGACRREGARADVLEQLTRLLPPGDSRSRCSRSCARIPDRRARSRS
jgi:hypothetical protein